MEPNKGGRPRFELDAKVLGQIEQLAGYGLTVPQIAAVIGCSESTLHAKKHEAEVSGAFTRGRAKAEAIIGKSLFEKAKDGEGWAVQWWEKTRAGRSDKQTIEHTGKDGGAIEVKADASDADARLVAFIGTIAARLEAAGGQGDTPAPDA